MHIGASTNKLSFKRYQCFLMHQASILFSNIFSRKTVRVQLKRNTYSRSADINLFIYIFQSGICPCADCRKGSWTALGHITSPKVDTSHYIFCIYFREVCKIGEGTIINAESMTLSPWKKAEMSYPLKDKNDFLCTESVTVLLNIFFKNICKGAIEKEGILAECSFHIFYLFYSICKIPVELLYFLQKMHMMVKQRFNSCPFCRMYMRNGL